MAMNHMDQEQGAGENPPDQETGAGETGGNPIADAIGAVQNALQGMSEGLSDQNPEASKLFQQALGLVTQAADMMAQGGAGAQAPVEQQAGGNANAVPMR